MNAIEAALLRDDDYTSVWLSLDSAVRRGDPAGLVFDLEIVFGDLLNRAARARLTTGQAQTLQQLLGVCRRRCERHLPPHCSAEEVRAGFYAARLLVDMLVAPPICRSGHTIEDGPYAEILRLHGLLRSMRRDQVLSTSPEIEPFATCEIIPFPKPFRGHVR